MTDFPSPLGGNDPLVRWLNKLLAACKGRTVLESPGIKADRTTTGMLLKIRPGGAGTASGGGMNWRGQYTQSPPTPYQINDVVKIATGAAEGCYIKVATTSQDPDTGIGWVQIAPGHTAGHWT